MVDLDDLQRRLDAVAEWEFNTGAFVMPLTDLAALLSELRTTRAALAVAEKDAAELAAAGEFHIGTDERMYHQIVRHRRIVRGRSDGATPAKCWRCDGPLPPGQTEPWEPICDTCYPLAVAEAERRHSGVDLQTMPEPGVPTMNLLEGD